MNLTREDLARRCGVSLSTIRNSIKGLTPSLPILMLMAQALQCSVNDLAPDLEELEALEVQQG